MVFPRSACSNSRRAAVCRWSGGGRPAIKRRSSRNAVGNCGRQPAGLTVFLSGQPSIGRWVENLNCNFRQSQEWTKSGPRSGQCRLACWQVGQPSSWQRPASQTVDQSAEREPHMGRPWPLRSPWDPEGGIIPPNVEPRPPCVGGPLSACCRALHLETKLVKKW